MVEGDDELESQLNSFNQFVLDMTRTMEQLKSKMGHGRIEKESLNEK